MFDNTSSKIAYEELANRTALILDEIITGNNNQHKVKKIDDYFLEINKPKEFSGKKSEEVLYIKRFEDNCIYIQDNLHRNPKSMTVMEFYQSLEYLKIKFKPKPKKRGVQ